MIAVGPGAPDRNGKIIPTTVKAGDKVLLPGWGGNSIKLGDEVSRVQDSVKIDHSNVRGLKKFMPKEYFLFRDSEILAKIQE